ncbi:hypothetical protein Anas_09671 [Armadillidium nasatum]|uniref:Uncharacterized protein n=1 Tax=Armadillidium nasatum TaxID=96803 RepID=A0A5N5TJ40_9CRUS|nr:hypothetical protein Anas_09671 [Armadillidium nasatum]
MDRKMEKYAFRESIGHLSYFNIGSIIYNLKYIFNIFNVLQVSTFIPSEINKIFAHRTSNDESPILFNMSKVESDKSDPEISILEIEYIP